MKITNDDVRHIATLSRLSIDEGAMDKFTQQFNEILNYADTLQELDTTGIEPSTSVLPLTNVLRKDVVVPGVSHEAALKNAPDVANDGFKVPKVIE